MDVIESKDTINGIDPSTTFVIICRYIPLLQLLWLWRHRSRFLGIALFIDDDIAATVVEGKSGCGYKFYLIQRALLPLIYLNRILTSVWASTQTLAGSLAANAVIAPCPPPEVYAVAPTILSKPESLLRMAFHATGAHDAEHVFLMPIVKTALEKLPNLQFDVVAEGRIGHRWMRELGGLGHRVRVIKPHSWSAYLDEAVSLQADILLVPLLPGRVNAARADTKRIDAARLGAAAIFSRCKTYERCFTEGEILVNNNSQSWVEAIQSLADEPETRLRAKNATSASIAAMLKYASPKLPGLEDYFSER
ncbi:MAG TPA: hypothetical protein DDW73_06970 [Rhizobium sp.]|nr:hypothetical protein [Rhizobium sp.]